MILSTENRWRIALTQAGLLKGYFRDLGIPRPTEPTYLPYSEVVPQSQGGTALQGYINQTLVWERLNRFQLYLLETYRSGAGTGLLYLTVDRSDGQGAGFDWVDISCYPGVIAYSGMPGSRGNVKTGVQWVLNNVVILVAPSTFT